MYCYREFVLNSLLTKKSHKKKHKNVIIRTNVVIVIWHCKVLENKAINLQNFGIPRKCVTSSLSTTLRFV